MPRAHIVGLSCSATNLSTRAYGEFYFTSQRSEGFTFPGSRSSLASQLLDYTIPYIVISGMLGHTSVSITSGVVGHLIPGIQNEFAKLIDRTPPELS